MSVVEVLPLVTELGPDAPPSVQAEAAGLLLSDDAEPGITRVRRGRGWSFHLPDGTLLDSDERERCLALAVPPAWTDVWICAEPFGHLQATGRDDAGRKQYRYHDAWRDLREAAKFASLRRFGAVLPTVRARIDADLRRHELGHDRVLALVLALLDATLLRVGNDEYAAASGARGLTTLLPEHVEVGSRTVRFSFTGKGGSERDVQITDRRLASQLLRVEDEVDHAVFAWEAEDGTWTEVGSHHVNDHLRAVAGDDAVSAKDFRTWGGTVAAVAALRATEPAEDERGLHRQRLAAVDAASEVLGNTRAVARASYVHPSVLELHGTGAIQAAYDDEAGVVDHLGAHERALVRLLELP